jgi:Xaa-Pro dipeptidase
VGGTKIASDFRQLTERLPEIQDALRAEGLDGWLLYDLHQRNGVAAALLGLGDLTRRYFVLVPAAGEPAALVHGIEEAPWEAWPWSRRRYVGWKELEGALAELLGGRRRVAMEVSPGDAVPATDLVPAGVVELIRAAGPDVVSSAELITLFYSRWSAEGLASHRRAARVLAQVAQDAFRLLGARVDEGAETTEAELRRWVLDTLAERGVGVGADSIVANGVNAANPHYAPGERGAVFQRGDVVLLDLWAKEAEHLIYADQTWMAYLGPQVPERVAGLFEVIRDARDAAVDFLHRQWQAGAVIEGREVDDVCRGVVQERGYGAAFIHRTGHSIDTATHGMGPNIDNLETRDVRRLVPGVGFSIEPGIYLAGDVGLRTEINVYMGADGPEVTSPEPQRELFTLLES